MSRQHLVEVNRYGFSAETLAGIKANAYAAGNWPLVYILSDSATHRAYVGETTDTLTRLSTHLKHAHKKLLTTVHLISSDRFNKSATLDIESALIKYMAADGCFDLLNGNLGLAVSEIGAISERRLALLLDAGLSGLPPFLVRDGGVNSGFMIAQVTAAALASENKSLAHPASVDSLPTSANQEDHVSMATFAARRLADMVNNTAVTTGIEAMAACQGIELRRGPASSPLLEAEFAAIRERVAFIDEDRFMAPDVETMRRWALGHDGREWPAPLAAILPSRA